MDQPGRPALRPSPLALGVAQFARTDPDRLAVVDPRRSLTYSELDALSSGLARRLEAARQAERDPSTWTPVFTERSSDSVVALVAVARAGVPFVPVDAAEHDGRVEELFLRLGSPGIALVSSDARADLLPVGTTAISIAPEPTESYEPQSVDPGAPGAVVFTSGSTGRPKGVVKTWGSLDKAGLDFARRAADGRVERVSLLRPLSFGSALNTLTALSSGHSLHIVDPSTLEPDDLVRWLQTERITHANLGPALGATLTHTTAAPGALPDLTTIRMGGQASNWELFGRLRALAGPAISFVVHYSATEIGSAIAFVVEPDDAIGSGTVPLGRPRDPGRVRLEPLVDDPERSQIVVRDPAGLHYLGDPDLTDQQFFTDHDGVRCWRSGDLATIDSDGLWHHIGRVDDMVKINGFRIEPAEPEAALLSVPGVASAAVVVHTAESGKQRLVGHIVVTDPDLTPASLRSDLEARLPKHLVPTAFVLHTRLPITQRGKVDRAALRTSTVEPWRIGPRRATRDERELWVAGQIARIVDVRDVDPDDDIWHLGLDSLGALELCAAITAAGLPSLDPTVLLTRRTPARIARLIDDSPTQLSGSAVVLNPGGGRQALLAVPGGGGTAFAFRSLAQALGPDQPLVVLEPRGMHRAARVDRTIDAILDSALEQSQAFDQGDPWVVLGYSAGGPVSFELARRLHEQGRPVHLVLLDATPFHPSGTRPGIAHRVGARSLRDNMSTGLMSLRRRWYVVRPGSPNYDRARYDAFATILRRATEHYRPEPVDFPASLVHIASTGHRSAVCEPLFPSLRVHEVGGDHYTMLHPPHMHPIVDALHEIVGNSSGPPAGFGPLGFEPPASATDVDDDPTPHLAVSDPGRDSR